jgi:hypothetical protein
MGERQKGKPRWVKEIAWRAQNRLHARFTTLRGRLMHHNKAKVAVARELTAFIWEVGFKLQSNAAR